MTPKFLKCLFASIALSFAAGAAAQQYPNKPIKIINPWTAAGPAELLARIIAAKISESLGQPVIVENKP